MPTPLVFYAFAFEGAPARTGARGWFVAPATPHLLAPRARTALGRASSPFVEIYRCAGQLHGRDLMCESALLLYVGDAEHELRWFALYCARSVANRWYPPALVTEFLRTGDLDLREVANARARAAVAMSDHVARMAATVAVHATSQGSAATCAREACKLATRIATLDSPDTLQQVQQNQERALSSMLLALDGRALTGEEPVHETPFDEWAA
jgi:hypothetical protein